MQMSISLNLCKRDRWTTTQKMYVAKVRQIEYNFRDVFLRDRSSSFLVSVTISRHLGVCYAGVGGVCSQADLSKIMRDVLYN